MGKRDIIQKLRFYALFCSQLIGELPTINQLSRHFGQGFLYKQYRKMKDYGLISIEPYSRGKNRLYHYYKLSDCPKIQKKAELYLYLSSAPFGRLDLSEFEKDKFTQEEIMQLVSAKIIVLGLKGEKDMKGAYIKPKKKRLYS